MALTAWASIAEVTKTKAQNFLLFCKGQGTNEIYAMEVDQTTGRLPVDAIVTFDYDTDYGVVGADTLRTAAQIGNATGAAAFGAGTTTAQVLRVVLPTDQTAIPVTGTVVANEDKNYGVVGANTLRTAAQIGNATGAAVFGAGTVDAQTLRVIIASDQSAIPASQSGTWNITNISGTVSLPTGAATEATLVTLNGKVASDYGGASGAVRVAAQIGNASAVADFNSGNTSAQTLRVVVATNQPAIPTSASGKTKVDLVTYDYSGGSVTTAAYTQILASTAGAITRLMIFDSSGQGMILATGAAAAEVDQIYIPPGGFESNVDLAIAASTRLSIKALTATASTGRLIMSCLS